MTDLLSSPAVRRTLVMGAFAATCVLTLGCGAGTNPAAVPVVPPNTSNNVLTQAEVQSIATAAAASVNVPVVVAVSDRRGQILTVYVQPGAPATVLPQILVRVSLPTKRLRRWRARPPSSPTTRPR